MKVTKSILLTALLISICSCGSSIKTTVSKKYQKTDANNVTVYDPGQAVPNSSEVIGTVRMADKGAFTDENYGQLIQQGKEETAKAGGNGLMINKYSYDKSRTVIKANMLYLKDMYIDSTAPNPSMEAEKLFQNQIDEYKKKRRLPANTLSIGAGYGWITSTLLTGDGYKLNPLGGAEIRAEYNHTFKFGLGVGLLYSGYFRNIKFINSSTNLSLNYIGPTITYGLRFDRFIARVGYGVGIGLYHELKKTVSCVGQNLDLKLEYMLTKNIGLNFTTSYVGFLFGMDSSYSYDNSLSAINRVALTGGLNLYF